MTLGDQSVTLLGEGSVAAVDVTGASLDLRKFEQSCLVEVGEATSFGSVVFELPVDPGELDGDEFVIGCWSGGGDGALPGEEHVGAEQGGADLFEDEGVERLGSDVAFWAALGPVEGADGVVGAPVVAVDLAAVGHHFLAADRHAAAPAAHQSSQQPCLDVVGQVPRAPFRVVPTDSLGCLEDGLHDDRRARDRDPFLPRPSPLSGRASPVACRGHRLGLVVVDAPDVGLVSQDPAHGGMPPLGFAGRGGHGVGVESSHDLTDGVPAGEVVVENAPHHDRFRFEHLEAGGTGAVAGDTPIPIGRLPRHDFAGAGAIQPAASVPLADLGSLVFGDHALHLGQQACLGVVVEGGGVVEQHPDPEGGQFVEHQDLIHVGARQAIG